jgi:hypothetical protein
MLTVKVVDLDALVSDARLPRVRLFGREVTVRPISGAAAHKLAVAQEADPTGVSLMGALLDVVRSSCPELTAAEVDRLTVDQLGALVQLTRGAVAEVEAQLASQDAGQDERSGAEPAAGN